SATWQRRFACWPRDFPPDASNAFHDHVLDDTGAAATVRGGRLVLGRLEACDALLERRKFNDDEAVKGFRPLHDLIAPAARQDLPPITSDDVRNEIGVLLVLDGI